MSDAGVSTTLEFNIDDALSAIDELEARLASVSQITLEADTEQMVSEIEDALARAAGVVTIEDTDASSVEQAIDDAIGAADSTVEVDADTALAEAELAGLSADPVDVEVDADTAGAQDAINSLEAEPIDVELSVDTGAADTQLQQVGQAGDQAASGMSSATGAATAFGAAAGVARGSGTGLVSTLETTGTSGAAAAGIIGALVAVTGELFSVGTRVTSGQQRFNLVLGSSADAVRRIDVGNLNTDLADLAQATGSGATGLRNAAASAFLLGDASDLTRHQNEQFTESVVALSSRIAAMNPKLGEAGDIADRLPRVLAAGGARLATFGIALNKVDIEAEAARLGFHEVNGEFTRGQLAAAGASLAMQQVGGSLRQDIAAGSENAAIRLRQVQKEFVGFLAEAGKPLVSPILGLLEDAVPVAGAVADVFGELAGAVLPALGAGLSLLGPPLRLLSGLLTAIPDPVIAGVAAFFALQALLPAVSAGLDSIAIAAYEAAGGLTAADIAAAANPLTLLAAGLAVGVAAFLHFTGGADDAAEAASKAEQRVRDMADSLSEAAGPAADAYADAVRTASDTNEHLDESMSRTGTSAEQLSRMIINAGGDIVGLNQRFADLDFGSGFDSNPFKEFNNDLQDAAHLSLRFAVSAGEIPPALAAAARETNRSEGGTVNYAAALSDARDATDAYVAATGQAVDESGQIVQAFGLAGTAAEKFGSDTLDGMTTALTSIQDLNNNGAVGLQEFVDSIGLNALAISGFVTNVESIANRGFPNLAAALFELGPDFATAAQQAGTASDATLLTFENVITGAVNMKDLTVAQAQDLKAQLTAALGDPAAADAFINSLSTIPSGAAQAGQDAASGLSNPAAAATSGQATGTAFGTSLAVTGVQITSTAMAAIAATIAAGAPLGIAASTGTATGSVFGASFAVNAAAITRTGMSGLGGLIASGAPYGQAGAAGRRVGQNLGAGIVAGIRDTVGAIASTAANAVNEAEAAARAAADSHSPSRLFARLGEDLGRGLELGIESRNSAVAAAGAGLIGAAVPDVTGAATSANGAGVVPAGGGAGDIIVERIEMAVSFTGPGLPDKAKRDQVAGEMADSFVDALEVRRIVTDSKVS